MPNPTNLPSHLLEARMNRTLVPFVGAGVSMAVRKLDGSAVFPSWENLLSAAADELQRQNRREENVVRALLALTPPKTLEAAHYAQDGLSSLWGEFLRDQFDVSSTVVDKRTLDLAEAIWGLGSSLVITTNYDRVLKWSCPDIHDLNEWAISAPSDQAQALKGRLRSPTVWHLHGNLSNTSQIILAPDGYSTLYPTDEKQTARHQHEAALETLRFMMTTKTFLFVGFSLTDQYFMRQLEWVNEKFAGCLGPHYVIGRNAEAERLRANSGNLDLQLLLVENHADIPALVRSLAVQEPTTKSGKLVEVPAVNSKSAVVNSSPNPVTGEVLAGRYELLERAGDGNFATVWRALDRQAEREVAVKVLHSQWNDKPGRVDRFRRGARAMRRLQHPCVVEVLEPVVRDGYRYFFVMSWQAGRDLVAAMESGELNRGAALSAVADALEGLAYAHESGLIHRDVKPANILLSEEYHGAIADFDLVGRMESKQGTRTSAGMGTVAYAAPELFDDAMNADERADLYGAAMCVLYVLTGADPPLLVSALKPAWLDSVKCSARLREALRGALLTDKDTRVGDCRILATVVREEPTNEPEVRGAFTDPDKEFVYQVLELYGHLNPPNEESMLEHPLMPFPGFGKGEEKFLDILAQGIEKEGHFSGSKQVSYLAARPMADTYRRMLAAFAADRAVNRNKNEEPYDMGDARRAAILNAALEGGGALGSTTATIGKTRKKTRRKPGKKTGKQARRHTVPDLDKRKMRRALAEFDAVHRNSSTFRNFVANKKQAWAILSAGQLYPVKKIVELATGIAVGNLTQSPSMREKVKAAGYDVVKIAEYLSRHDQS